MRKLKMGMIGGGKNAFIGAIHRIAANMDGLVELHCGAFSSNPEISKESGKGLFLPEAKCYDSYEKMIAIESQLPQDQKMDFVTIVTPNFTHFAPAMMALNHGFHVLIDKPMTLSLDEAKQLQQKVKETGLILCLTHTYSGYPMVKQARKMVADNDFGKIRKVIVEYTQGWLSSLLESKENKQALWRTDPAKSGISGCMGDIGTHAAHLAEYISGLKIAQLCADINIVVEGRKLDDDGNVLLKFDNGANGILVATQIATGEENGLKIKIYGEKGGLEWHQMEPNSLIIKWSDAPTQIYRTGNGYLSNISMANSRTPSGHPEGYLEAFANLYKNFALTLSFKLEGKEPTQEMLDFPSVDDGVRGMAFIENVIASGKSDQKWFDFKI
ncbi:Gfo/Idh/MocA family protein [Flavobacterium acetivorans]|uniref:Gfo/Idh/MocA family protein n=1 Tax=Flavobacterium acetivorans TaxID=2893883 RepID=UPI001E2C1E8C|nr:Gfo/Idh/MocA family oxidoreductase [Flavobacterium sp. F-29]UFH34852.1 Gfo/Idh/MocA family oxidoreductase [Flavobacterium sp. F-29]